MGQFLTDTDDLGENNLAFVFMGEFNFHTMTISDPHMLGEIIWGDREKGMRRPGAC
jgi:hypothetical protein